MSCSSVRGTATSRLGRMVNTRAMAAPNASSGRAWLLWAARHSQAKRPAGVALRHSLRCLRPPPPKPLTLPAAFGNCSGVDAVPFRAHPLRGVLPPRRARAKPGAQLRPRKRRPLPPSAHLLTALAIPASGLGRTLLPNPAWGQKEPCALQCFRPPAAPHLVVCRRETTRCAACARVTSRSPKRR